MMILFLSLAISLVAATLTSGEQSLLRASCQDVTSYELVSDSCQLHGYLNSSNYSSTVTVSSSKNYGLIGFGHPIHLPTMSKGSYAAELGVKFAMCDGHNQSDSPRFQLGLYEYWNATNSWDLILTTNWNTFQSQTDIYQFFPSTTAPALSSDRLYRIAMAVEEQTSITVYSTQGVSPLALHKLQQINNRHRRNRVTKGLPRTYIMPQGLSWLSLGMTICKKSMEL